MTGPIDTQLSVVIPTKNRPVLLRHAVLSALAQLLDGDRIVIVDDGSDAPVEAGLRAGLEGVKGYAPDRVIVLRNELSQRSAAARNRAVGATDTPWIVFLDDDDAFADGYLAALRTYWMSGEAVDYGYAMTRESVGSKPVAPVFEGLPDAPARSHLFPLSLGVWVSRAGFDATGGMQPELTTNQDTEFCINLVKCGLRGVRYTGAGVIIDASDDQLDRDEQGQEGNITKTMKSGVRASCFALILQRHADWLSTPEARVFRSFCVRRLIELQAKSGKTFEIPDEISVQLSASEKTSWQALYWANRGARAIQRRAP